MFRRLRHNFQLSIICLMGVIGVLGIAPYAIYRFMQGNYIVAIADSIIVLSTCLAVIYAWRSGNTERPGYYLATVFSVGATLVMINLGTNGLFWFYPLILFNFFMVSPGKALLATLAVLCTLTIYSRLVPQSIFDSSYQMSSFIVTCIMSSGLTFIFAYRTYKQRDQLQTMAIQDPLTGARNRRAMNDELKIAVSSKQRSQRHYGLLAMDLDHFKQVNDHYGHHAGDQVLIDFVDLVKQHTRVENRLFRQGGEEFLLLLPDCDAAGLNRAAEHLIKVTRNHLRGPGGAVTVSIGGALLHANEPWKQWLQRADECLYQAKSSGRNRYVIDASLNERSAESQQQPA